MAVQFLERWLNRPGDPEWSPGHRRFYKLTLQSYPLGTFVHILFFALFAYLDVWPLVWFNLFSIILWAFASAMIYQRKFEAAIYLSSIEVAAHGVFASVVIGWDSGFHIYILFWAAQVFTIPIRRIAFTCFFPLVLSWVTVYLFTVNANPWVVLPTPLLLGMTIANFLVHAFLLAFIYARATAFADRVEADLEREYQRSQNLLHNILPKSIAERLKEGEELIADGFEEASVLFSDIVGFTILSTQVTPARLVEMLNRIFSRIDGLVDKYGLEKIKTIGDAYMVASGIPEWRKEHAEDLADFAIEMLDVLEEVEQSYNTRLEMRVGMHTGPVIAGVIGTRKFAYDLWGDTVNTAARMESHGKPGQIQMTEATHQKLKEKFEIEFHNELDIKGKGMMKTYFLIGRK